MTLSSNFFWSCHVSFVKFSYWSKFHANIKTGSGVMTIFVYKGLTRNPEIGNTPAWFLPNIWRLGQVRDSKFGVNVSNKILMNAAKCQGYSFHRFWVINGKPTRGKFAPPSIQIRVKKPFHNNCVTKPKQMICFLIQNTGITKYFNFV